jgi:hypothetical protein
MTVQLPPDRRLRILKELRTAKKRIYKKKMTSVRTLATLIGMLSATRIQFPKASLYLKRLSTILHTRVNEEGSDTWTPWPHRTLAELRWWSNTITENNPHSIMKDPPPQIVITTDVAAEVWGATLQIVKKDKFFNPEKEVKKLTLTEILQSTITEDGRVFCPTNINNSKWSYTDQLGLKERQKLQKEYQVVQQNWNRKMKIQTSNLKELTAIHHLALEHFLPQIKKANFTSILIRTDNTSAMYVYQPKDWCSKSLYDNQKNLVYDRPKWTGSKSRSHSRKIKYDDGQTESSGDERRLLSPTKNLSIHSRDTQQWTCLLRKRTDY